MKRKYFNRIMLVLLAAVILLSVFLADTLIKYFKGSEFAMDPMLLIIFVLISLGSIAVICTLMWREWKRLKQQRDYFDE